MNKSINYILGLVVLFSLANIALAKNEVELEAKFLSIIIDYSEPQVTVNDTLIFMPLAHINTEDNKMPHDHYHKKQNLSSFNQSNSSNFNLPLGIYEDYDMYVLSIQWGNTLCLTSNSASCHEKIKAISKNIFTMHGLWPNYAEGPRMQRCNPGQDIKITEDGSEIFVEMDSLWLSYTTSNSNFWTHEYNTHGMCYTNKYKIEDPILYFKFSLNLFKQHSLDQLMTQAFGEQQGLKQFTLTELKNRLQAATPLAFELACKIENGKDYLQEVRFFFDLNMAPQRNHKHSGECRESHPIYVDFL